MSVITTNCNPIRAAAANPTISQKVSHSLSSNIPDVGTQRVGYFLRNRRIGGGCPDWIAIRRYYAHCREARTPYGGGRGRICDTDDRSFLRGIALVSPSARP